MINNEEKIKELEEKIEMLTKERDYYQQRYLECNDVFLQRIKIKPKTSAMLDEENNRYICEGKVIDLTFLQTLAINTLVRNKNKVVTYAELEREVYGKEYEEHNTIRRFMCRLIRKMQGSLEIKRRFKIGYYI